MNFGHILTFVLHFSIFDSLQVQGLCKSSGGDDYTKLVACVVSCEIAVQSKDMNEYTSVLGCLLDLLLSTDTFHKREVQYGLAIMRWKGF